MEPEKPFRWGSKISVESKRSQLSSCRSLDRGSWEEPRHSLSKHYTMVEVMSLEGSKKSDILEKMLAEDNPPPPKTESQVEETDFNPFKTVFKLGAEAGSRLSYQDPGQVSHTCTCHISCNLENCPCFRSPEACLQGFCCSECMNAKAKKTVRSGVKPKVFCTCKKAKCVKKYCTCYAAGIKCGEYCSCQDCLNCQKTVKVQFQPAVRVEDSIRNLEMPGDMEFQPFNYRSSLHSDK